jgi:hypothetical protein
LAYWHRPIILGRHLARFFKLILLYIIHDVQSPKDVNGVFYFWIFWETSKEVHKAGVPSWFSSIKLFLNELNMENILKNPGSYETQTLKINLNT